MAELPITTRIVETESDIGLCFPLMKQLRQELTFEEFVKRIAGQQKEGYMLALAECEGRVVSVAGFRIMHMLASGKTLYIDDLVTDEGARSRGFGKALVLWLANYGRKANCQTLSLDSGVQRRRAHGFYFLQGMHISDFHFELSLEGGEYGRLQGSATR